jgi:hypothetical protein
MKELNFNPLGYAGIVRAYAVADHGETLGKDPNYTIVATNFTENARVPVMKGFVPRHRKKNNVLPHAFFMGGSRYCRASDSLKAEVTTEGQGWQRLCPFFVNIPIGNRWSKELSRDEELQVEAATGEGTRRIPFRKARYLLYILFPIC